MTISEFARNHGISRPALYRAMERSGVTPDSLKGPGGQLSTDGEQALEQVLVDKRTDEQQKRAKNGPGSHEKRRTNKK